MTIEFFISELVWEPNFGLNWQFRFFEPKLLKKGSYFQPKADKIDTTICSCIFKSIFVSLWTNNFEFFDQIGRMIFMVKNSKSEHHLWILHSQISLGTKYLIKLTILMFWTKFAQKGFLLVWNRKSEHKHWILQDQISIGNKFQLKLTSLIFCTKFAQKDVSGWKQKKCISPWNSAYFD